MLPHNKVYSTIEVNDPQVRCFIHMSITKVRGHMRKTLHKVRPRVEVFMVALWLSLHLGEDLAIKLLKVWPPV